MTVSLTLLRWVRLYSSMSARLNAPVSDRVHMVRTVASSTAAVPVGAGPTWARWQADIVSTTARAAAQRHPDLRAPIDRLRSERMLAIT